MGDLKAPIAAVAGALCALALGVPASAAAEGPVDAASAVQAVQQRVDAVAGPATQQATSVAQGTTNAPAPAVIRETVERAAGRAPEARGAGADDRVAPVGSLGHATPTSGRRVAGARTLHANRAAHAVSRRTTKTTSPPHGRKAMSPARSLPERAGASHAARHASAATPPLDGGTGGTGTADGARAYPSPNTMFFAALLTLTLIVSRPMSLRPLQLPAPALRRLAFVSPGVPPG